MNPLSASENAPIGVFEAIYSRRSVRAFLPKPIGRDLVEKLLHAAARAPSGTNMQPWHVYVITGAARAALIAEVRRIREKEPHRERSLPPYGEYEYNPEPLFEPYLGRRRKLGWELYSLLGIAKGDREASWVAAGRNFEFFGAPVGMIFTIDRKLQAGSWLDFGMFLQTLMLAAKALALDTCAQAAWRHYHDVLRRHLQIPDNELVICGMSLGYADPESVANLLRSERDPVEGFARFIDSIPETAVAAGHASP